MKEPVLVIMAAGMGSRYGGLKQIDPVDDDGHIIMDFSIYDAAKAGFKTVVFLIKHEIEEEFKNVIGKRIGAKMDVRYAFQETDMLPEGFSVPAGRIKPWGTGHAILCAKAAVDNAPFAVINADDFYGADAFSKAYAFLKDDGLSCGDCNHAMVGYRLYNTLTENGTVSRGVCEVSDDGRLLGIKEHTKIKMQGEGAQSLNSDTDEYEPLSPDLTVSMNMWCFKPSFFDDVERSFIGFLGNEVSQNPLKSEHYLPTAVAEMISSGRGSVTVFKSEDKWFGVTYKEDRQAVVNAVSKLKNQGKYVF